MRRTASQIINDLEMRVARLERKASKFDHLKSPQTGKIYDHLRETAPRDEFRKLEELYDHLRDIAPRGHDDDLEDRLTNCLESDGLRFTKDGVVGGVKMNLSQGMVVFDLYVPVFDGGYSVHKGGFKIGEYGDVLIDEPEILRKY